MTKAEAIERIKDLLKQVEREWKANGGGLTWAASDALSLGHSLIEMIQRGDVEGIKDFDAFDCSTGIEQEMTIVAQEWAEDH